MSLSVSLSDWLSLCLWVSSGSWVLVDCVMFSVTVSKMRVLECLTLFHWVSLCLCLSVYVSFSISLSVTVYLCFSDCLYVCPSVSLTVSLCSVFPCLSLWVSLCVSLCQCASLVRCLCVRVRERGDRKEGQSQIISLTTLDVKPSTIVLPFHFIRDPLLPFRFIREAEKEKSNKRTTVQNPHKWVHSAESTVIDIRELVCLCVRVCLKSNCSN